MPDYTEKFEKMKIDPHYLKIDPHYLKIDPHYLKIDPHYLKNLDSYASCREISCTNFRYVNR